MKLIQVTTLLLATLLTQQSTFADIRHVPLQLQPTIKSFRGMCDASGALNIDENRFIVGNDEDNILRVYDRNRYVETGGQNGNPLFELNLSSHLNLEAIESDIEAAADLDGFQYWITSHGRNKKGKLKNKSRYRFFSTFTSSDGIGVVGRSYDQLIEDMLNNANLGSIRDLLKKSSKLDDSKDKKLAPKKNGLNIEGLAPFLNGAHGLYIGLRNPLTVDGRAILIPLINPYDVIHNRAAGNFSTPVFLDLGGLAFRSIEAVKDRNESYYLIVAGQIGSETDIVPSRLYKWSGNHLDTRPQFLHELPFNPEALIYTPENHGLFVISDDGTREIDEDDDQDDDDNQGVACKLLPIEQRIFRTSTWQDKKEISALADLENTKQPAISVNEHGEVISIFTRNGRLLYRLGRHTNEGIEWIAGEYPVVDSGSPSEPSVALNNQGYALVAFEENNQVFYRLGRMEGIHFEWLTAAIAQGIGIRPYVALDDDNYFVGTHQYRFELGHQDLWYLSGKVSNTGITRLNAQKDRQGREPAIAMIDRDQYTKALLEVHMSEFHQKLWFRTGLMDKSSGTIRWQTAVEHGLGNNPSLAITRDGRVVETHRSNGLDGIFQYEELWYRVGTLDPQSLHFTLPDIAFRYSVGTYPYISIAGHSGQYRLVEAHEIAAEAGKGKPIPSGPGGPGSIPKRMLMTSDTAPGTGVKEGSSFRSSAAIVHDLIEELSLPFDQKVGIDLESHGLEVSQDGESISRVALDVPASRTRTFLELLKIPVGFVPILGGFISLVEESILCEVGDHAACEDLKLTAPFLALDFLPSSVVAKGSGKIMGASAAAITKAANKVPISSVINVLEAGRGGALAKWLAKKRLGRIKHACQTPAASSTAFVRTSNSFSRMLAPQSHLTAGTGPCRKTKLYVAQNLGIDIDRMSNKMVEYAEEAQKLGIQTRYKFELFMKARDRGNTEVLSKPIKISFPGNQDINAIPVTIPGRTGKPTQYIYEVQGSNKLSPMSLQQNTLGKTPDGKNLQANMQLDSGGERYGYFLPWVADGVTSVKLNTLPVRPGEIVATAKVTCCGVALARDKKGNIWLNHLNTSTGDPEKDLEVYKKWLKDLPYESSQVFSRDHFKDASNTHFSYWAQKDDWDNWQIFVEYQNKDGELIEKVLGSI